MRGLRPDWVRSAWPELFIENLVQVIGAIGRKGGLEKAGFIQHQHAVFVTQMFDDIPLEIITHLVGIPMILLALQVLLSRPVLADAGVPVTPALILTAITALYYLRLDRPLGALMALLMAAGLALAWPLASQSTPRVRPRKKVAP